MTDCLAGLKAFGRHATAGLLIFLAFTVSVTAKFGPAPELVELAIRLLFGGWLLIAAYLIVARRSADQ